jgi:hypothetical protein
MSERDLTPAVKSELDRANVQLGLLVEIIFDSGPLRLWSGSEDRTFFGNLFRGVGGFGGIDRVEETAGDIRASGIAFTLSGISVDQLSLALQEQFQGRVATVWLQMFDIDWAPLDAAIKLNKYKCDYPVIDKGGDTFTITVYAESILADLERARVRRYTHEDQQMLYPGDRGLEFVAAIQNKEVIWRSAE